MNINDIQALPDSLQIAIKLLPFEKSEYVLVINPFLKIQKMFYQIWKIIMSTER